MVEQALSDVKILDLSWHISGPYCTKYFADYGADVIKIEKPGEGDPARNMGPFYKDDPHPEKSGLFLHLNTNKKSVTLNLKSDTGKKIFMDLVKDVDIVVESFSPYVMPSLGLSYEELEKINPKLVMVSISNFGQTGPYRDYKASELVENAMGHTMFALGQANREPLKLGGSVVQFQSGTVASTLTMFALFGKDMNGIGQHLDISIMETQLGTIDRAGTFFLSNQYRGDLAPRGELTSGIGFPTGITFCKDGFIDVMGGAIWFPKTAQMLDMPELATDERFAPMECQINSERRDEFFATIWYPYLAEHTMHEIFTKAQESGLLCAPLNTPETVFHDEHFKEREYFVDIDHPMTGKLQYPGAPFKSELTPWQIRRRAPLLGEHNEEVFGKLGYSKEDMVKLREQGVI